MIQRSAVAPISKTLDMLAGFNHGLRKQRSNA
jgi:hypothetical protein